MIRDIENGARAPRVHPAAYVDPSAQVIGDVEIGEGSSVWPLALVRGDQNSIRIGRYTNVQDLSVLHVSPGFPLIVGDHVTFGHRVVVHGCRIMDNSRIGIGAIVMDGAVIEEWAQVAAGSIVPPGKVVKSGWLFMGSPAKPVRQLSQAELDEIHANATEYHALWQANWPR